MVRTEPELSIESGGGWIRAGLLLLVPLLLGSVCEGNGDRSQKAVKQTGGDAGCSNIIGRFPSGFAMLPETDGHAVVVRYNPMALLTFDLNPSEPQLLGPQHAPPFPSDSDGDGIDDADRYVELGICRKAVCRPDPGEVTAFSSNLVGVSSSTYDQVMFYETMTGELSPVLVETPDSGPDFDPFDYPVLPPAGSRELRTALSTKTCVYPGDVVDSLGDAIPASPLCEPDVPSYLTTMTNAKASAAGRLFVATANLVSGIRYYPGTILVFDFDLDPDLGPEPVDGSNPPLLRPSVEQRMIFTSRFNPTGVTSWVSATGRELILVTLTGAISSAGSVLSEGAIDVIDAETLRLAATIPLEFAGPAFGPLAIDPAGRIALVGSASKRNLYAIDLRALSDPDLYDDPNAAPVLLDGSTPGFPDARIFSGDAPFPLPHRRDGPDESSCPTITNVALNAIGDLAVVSDWCDGTMIVVEVDWSGALEQPISQDRFRVQQVRNILAPKDPFLHGLATSPSMIQVRPGAPGLDYTGPDVFYIANEEEAQICAVRVDS